MKPRQKDEADDAYIARLEAANSALRNDNAEAHKAMRRVYDVVVPAAQKAGLLFQCAAEVCGKTEDPEVAGCIKALESLGSCHWNDDRIEVPDLPKIEWGEPRFSGDLDMLVHSALEQVKCRPEDHGRLNDLLAVADHQDLSKLDWRELWYEVCDALSDLEGGRQMLRWDMRSAMYDYCFHRIAHALQHAEARTNEQKNDEAPW